MKHSNRTKFLSQKHSAQLNKHTNGEKCIWNLKATSNRFLEGISSFVWQNFFYEISRDSNDESTTRQEKVKNLQELNKRFVSQTQQANSKVLELQNLLATKEAELASLKVQFKKTEEMDDLQHALELAAQLKEKEKLISLNSAEILLKDRLLEDAELHNQKLNNERVKLCQLLQNTKKEAQSGQKHKVSDENGSMQFEAILATKESELQDLKFQNHNLANVVLSLEKWVLVGYTLSV